ncbi:MAG: tripartite tricarboxylate transporter substrate binding protein [Pigmentiphaga sp.]|nr:tripartite tricarboxylate transporter substrate binding protein [Pigmentiphaga sp.]
MDFRALLGVQQGDRVLRQAFALALALAAFGFTPASSAQGTLTMTVASSPGVGADILARALSLHFSNEYGMSAVVENRPGASGNIGADHVARAKPDGHSLLVAATTFATNAAVDKKLPYDPIKSFEPVALLGTGTMVLVVNDEVPADSLKAFIALAKSKPGQINYASAGNGTPQHLAMELFKQEAGVDLFHVPFKSGGAAVNDLAGGHVSAMIAPIHTVMTLIKSGKLKPIAVMSGERESTVPEVPTFREQGYPKVQVDVWYALMAPAGTPADIIKDLNRKVNEALRTEAMLQSLAKQSIKAQGGTPERMAAVLENEVTRWPPVVRAAGISAD